MDCSTAIFVKLPVFYRTNTKCWNLYKVRDLFLNLQKLLVFCSYLVSHLLAFRVTRKGQRSFDLSSLWNGGNTMSVRWPVPWCPDPTFYSVTIVWGLTLYIFMKGRDICSWDADATTSSLSVNVEALGCSSDIRILLWLLQFAKMANLEKVTLQMYIHNYYLLN